MDEKGRIRIRKATPDDAEQLREIYRPYVEKTAITFEYEVPTVENFRSRIGRTLERYPYLAAVRDSEEEQIVGYAYTGPFKERAAYDWAAETSVYVAWGCQKMGIGKLLYQALEVASAKQHIINLNACIGVPGEAAGGDEYLTDNSEQFHAHMGYRLVGRFHECGYKFGRWYDMVWMEKFLGEHPDRPQPVVPFPEI